MCISLQLQFSQMVTNRADACVVRYYEVVGGLSLGATSTFDLSVYQTAHSHNQTSCDHMRAFTIFNKMGPLLVVGDEDSFG